MEQKHTQSEMPMQAANADTVKCKTCIYRDPATVEIGGKVVPVGVTRAWCDMYPKDESNGKPIGVLMRGETCEAFQSE